MTDSGLPQSGSAQRPRARVRWVAAAVAWLVVCGVAVCVAVLGLLSQRRLRSPVEIESAYAALVSGQTFFLVFLWPLFEWSREEAGWVWGVGDALVRLLGLFLLSAPLVLVAVQPTVVRTSDVMASHAVLFLVGAAVAIALRLPGSVAWYYPSAFFLSAAVPLGAYLLRELGNVPTEWAAALCPFWAVGRAASGGRWLASALTFAALAGLGMAGLLQSARRMARTSRAGE